ncbi:outer membrane beta-barrel protein [Saprospiraceae bacterium]|nr:outer membrane beta-barrel protein [Saprospiraceae bacterium]
MKLLLFGLAMLLTSSIYAQFEMIGTINDGNSPLIGATVVVVHSQDSTMLAFGITNDKGDFKIYDIPYGNHLAQVSYTGYQTKFIACSSFKEKRVNLGQIELVVSTEILKEVKISAERIPMGIYGDTISYNASAFKTKEGASVEDLLKKLPGIDVDRNGAIKAYGEDVDKVLVDGREFFSGDATMATKNLEAVAVDKVQVFDKKSDEAEFTEIDDGEEDKTINIQLKEDYKNGGFGKVAAEGGTETRYKAKVNYNRFSPVMQTSVLANSNNINEQAFSFMDYIDFMGGLGNLMNGNSLGTNGLFNQGQEQQGIDRANATGLNFNYFKYKKINFSSNYMFINNQNILESRSVSKNFNLQQQYGRLDSLDNIARLTNHAVNTRTEIKINPLNKIILKVNGGLRLGALDEESRTIFEQDNAIINDINYLQNSANIQYSGKFSSIYIKKFTKKGRNLKLKADYSQLYNSETNKLRNQFNTASGLLEINQNQELLSKDELLDVTASFMESIAKKTYVTMALKFRQNLQKPERKFYDANNGNQIFNDQLSGSFVREWQTTTASFLFQRNRKKVKLFTGIDLATTSLGAFESTAEIDKNSGNYLLANSKLILKPSSSKKIELRYFGNLEAPTLRQLISIPDNLNSTSITLGNSLLNPQYFHNVQLNMNHINQFSFTNAFLNIQYQYSKNKIVFDRLLNEDLTTIISPSQSPYFHSLNSYFSYSSPIRKLKIKLDFSTNLYYQTFQNSFNNTANDIQIGGLSSDFRIENRNKEKLDVAVGMNLDVSRYNSSLNSALSQDFINTSYYMDANYTLKDTWEFDLSYDLRNLNSVGLNDATGSRVQFHLLNIQIKKYLLKNKLSVHVRAHDLLNQNQGFDRNGTANSLYSAEYNTLGRYFTLGLSYKIGKKLEDKF